jgi:nuclear transport factor 2 (NTF2) superfamily protein
MIQYYRDIIEKAYNSFNARDIDAVLLLMHTDVHWPNGWEGGYVNGHEEVKDYWTRQWKELNPKVTPVSFKETIDGAIEVNVQQVVKDLKGTLLFDGMVIHRYQFAGGKIKSMEIEKS